MKFDPFGSSWRTLSRYDFDLSVDIIRAVRDAVGPSVDLLIEVHCRFNVATAIEFSEAIHQFRPAWFEEPVPHTNIAAMVEVARRSPVPVATGESLSNKQQFAELLQARRRQHPPAGAAQSGRLVHRPHRRRDGRRPLRGDRAPQRAGPGLFGGVRAAQRLHP